MTLSLDTPNPVELTNLLKRFAVIYVRQSDPIQLRDNPGSTAWQLAQQEQAIKMGWPPERIRVYADLGKSAQTTGTRPEFYKMLEFIGQRRVGMVFVVDGTRVARNHMDWAALIDTSSITDTWIFCRERAHNPNNSIANRRLGMISVRSVATGKALTRRFVQSRLHKAQQGKAVTPLPVGYVYKNCKIDLSQDEEVRAAIQTIFTTFERVGSALGTVKALREQHQLIPRLGLYGHGPVIWVEPSISPILQLLHNPRYTGTYVFGRHYIQRVIEGNKVKVQTFIRRRPEEWPVCIKNAFPAYITFQQYETNQQTINGNKVGSAGARTRESTAILNKILKCGLCGHNMVVFYDRNNKIVYRCTREVIRNGGRLCQSIVGRAVEASVLGAISQVLSAGQIQRALSTTMNAKDENTRIKAQHNRRRADLQKASSISKDSYLAAERRNDLDERLLTELKNDWLMARNKLDEFNSEEAERKKAVQNLPDATLFSGLERDFQKLWLNPDIDKKYRNSLIRSIVDYVEISKIIESKRIYIIIYWHSGAFSSLVLTDEDYAFLGSAIKASTINLILELAKTQNRFQIADHLNSLDLKAGKNTKFTAESVWRLLKKYNAPRHRKYPGLEGNIPTDTYTQTEVAALLGIVAQKVSFWSQEGTIQSVPATSSKGVILHYLPPHKIRKIKTYIGENRRREPNQSDRDSFQKNLMPESVWQELRKLLNVQRGEKTRETIDALIWVFHYQRCWKHVSLRFQTLDQLHFRIFQLRKNGVLEKLLHRLSELYINFDARKLIEVMSKQKNHNSLFFISLKNYLEDSSPEQLILV